MGARLGGRPEGIYLYVSSPRTGTPDSSPYIDALLLNGSQDSYPNGQSYYLRIDKSFVRSVLSP